MENLPFIMGAQYYRAPTPGPEAWEHDLDRMRAVGCNSVKYWVQWRWSSRESGSYYFDDLDLLMDLASERDLRVTLNVIFDVAPLWLYEKYPDAKQVRADGTIVEPRAVASRQIGGYPGPCLLHPGAREARMEFLTATVQHFKNHPAMDMWDIWNEAKLGLPRGQTRTQERLLCYCQHCRKHFIKWLIEKYNNDLQTLNAVWGRCYGDWGQVELPLGCNAIADFVDYREFQIETLAGEAKWRIDLAHTLDPGRTAYLHVVPSTGEAWDAVVCAADDFALAEPCDIFAATVNHQPFSMAEVLSAARGKTVYNVESHVNHGLIVRHQRELGIEDLRSELLPQIGMDIKGFMFWQFRSETLGTEAPGWGVINPDGTDRSVTGAVDTFFKTLQPHTDTLLRCKAPEPRVGIWKSRKNEIFHYAIHGNSGAVTDAVSFYCDALYYRHIPFRIVSEEILSDGKIDDLDMLIMPVPYYLTQSEADALADWVESGGVLLSEGNLGGYEATRGRHASVTPGCGLAERFGFQQAVSMPPSEIGLRLEGEEDLVRNEDVRKAMDARRRSGGRFFPVTLDDESVLWGTAYYAELEGETLQSLGALPGRRPCIAQQRAGSGRIVYVASYAANAASQGSGGLQSILSSALGHAGIEAPMRLGFDPEQALHVDILSQDGNPRYLVLLNQSDRSLVLRGEVAGKMNMRGLFSELEYEWSGVFEQELPPGFADLMELVE